MIRLLLDSMHADLVCERDCKGRGRWHSPSERERRLIGRNERRELGIGARSAPRDPAPSSALAMAKSIACVRLASGSCCVAASRSGRLSLLPIDLMLVGTELDRFKHDFWGVAADPRADGGERQGSRISRLEKLTLDGLRLSGFTGSSELPGSGLLEPGGEGSNAAGARNAAAEFLHVGIAMGDDDESGVPGGRLGKL